MNSVVLKLKIETIPTDNVFFLNYAGVERTIIAL